MRKRYWFVFAAAAIGVMAAIFSIGLSGPKPNGEQIAVYREPGCECCKGWEGHLRSAGFKVIAHEVTNRAALREKLGVPSSLASCHTAIVEGYAVEGHVPADAIATLLAERPKVRGVAVPGMPSGSPGMEGARKSHYTVFVFDEAGREIAYQRR